MVQSTNIIHKRNFGACQLRAEGCERTSEYLEWHHESYEPTPKLARKEEKGLYVCHSCHALILFQHWKLTQAQKEKLIMARLGKTGRLAAARGEVDVQALAAAYKPPVKP
jgi:hypothetical protein